MTRRRTSPEDARTIADHARDHLECQDCGAEPGEPCPHPGSGRSVCRGRFVSAAIEMKQALRAAARTLEQQAILTSLPKVPKAEIEKCRTPRGGYAFTKAWFVEHGLPYPPVAGWRQGGRTGGHAVNPEPCSCGSSDTRLYAEGWR